jgi:hypothetical protein
MADSTAIPLPSRHLFRREVGESIESKKVTRAKEAKPFVVLLDSLFLFPATSTDPPLNPSVGA